MPTTAETREEYLEKLKKQLDEWNSKIDEFEAGGEKLSGDALQKYNNQVYELRQQLKSVRTKFDQVRASGRENWDMMIGELEHIRDTFVHSFNYFKSQI
jgi:phage shock protein A